MERKHVHRAAPGIALAIAGMLAGCPKPETTSTPQPKASTSAVETKPPRAQYVFTIFFDDKHCMIDKDSSGPPGAKCDPADGTSKQCLRVPHGERLRFEASPKAGNAFIVKFQGRSPYGGNTDLDSKDGEYEEATLSTGPRPEKFQFKVAPVPGGCDKVIDPQIILN